MKSYRRYKLTKSRRVKRNRTRTRSNRRSHTRKMRGGIMNRAHLFGPGSTDLQNQAGLASI